MSELTIFKNANAVIPAYLKAGLDETTKSLMGGGSSKRISIRGGVFRMLVGGKEVAQNTSREMNLVVINAAPTNSRVFYVGKFDPAKDAVPPTCWSDDAEKPHKDVKAPQSVNCATCPQNIKGSGERDTRACRYQRRLAVMLENDLQGDIYALTLPAQSIFATDPKKMGLQQYARFLGGHGVSVNAVVTEAKFDTDVEAPKLTFSAVRPLTEEEYAAATAAKEHPDAVNAVTMNVAQIDGVEDAKPSAPMVSSNQQVPPVQTATPKPKASTGNGKISAVSEEIPEPVKRETAKPNVPDVKSILDDWAD